MKTALKDKSMELIGIGAIQGIGFSELVGWAVGADSVLGAAKVLASSAMVAARSPPVSLGSSLVSGAAAEGV